jgi:hypothetical protein
MAAADGAVAPNASPAVFRYNTALTWRCALIGRRTGERAASDSCAARGKHATCIRVARACARCGPPEASSCQPRLAPACHVSRPVNSTNSGASSPSSPPHAMCKPSAASRTRSAPTKQGVSASAQAGLTLQAHGGAQARARQRTAHGEQRRQEGGRCAGKQRQEARRHGAPVAWRGQALRDEGQFIALRGAEVVAQHVHARQRRGVRGKRQRGSVQAAPPAVRRDSAARACCACAHAAGAARTRAHEKRRGGRRGGE